MSIPLSSTDRTALRRHRERGHAERDELYAVLDAGLVCHLGVIVNGTPRVLPTAYGRLDDTLYLHGSSANAAILAADGQQVCVTVTHLDGLVCARSVFNHSMNYRSAMVYGEAKLITDDAEREVAFHAITEHLIPGRWAAVRPLTRKERAATSALAVPLTEASVKTRTGQVIDDAEDADLDVWAGLVPIRPVFGPPEPDPGLRPGIDVPDHIANYAR